MYIKLKNLYAVVWLVPKDSVINVQLKCIIDEFLARVKILEIDTFLTRTLCDASSFYVYRIKKFVRWCLHGTKRFCNQCTIKMYNR